MNGPAGAGPLRSTARGPAGPAHPGSRTSTTPGRRGWTGWRFTHPDLDATGPGAPAGSGGPGLSVDVTGRVSLVTDADAIRQSLLLLLTTRPGERIMRPRYGCDLHRLVFTPNDDTTAGLAIHHVRRAVERFEPRAQIVRVDAGPAPGRPDRLDVVLEYRPRAGGPSDTLTVTIALQDGA